METINTQSTVAEWVCHYPRTAHVFEQYQIDYCCGGDTRLAEACRQRELKLDVVLAQLEQSITETQEEVTTDNWKTAGLANLCDHIQETHHAYLRQELPRLAELLDKVVLAHGEQHPELKDVQRVYASLRAELEPHMMKEEQILFPAIRLLEQAASRPQFPFGDVANPIRMMEHEHDTVGTALQQLRGLTRDFLVPDDACSSYRVLFDSLRRLEEDLHQHIHKENNILFPRAQQLDDSFQQA